MIFKFGVHPGGWPRYRMRTRYERAAQRIREMWWVLTGKYSLHRAWQSGYHQGTSEEFQRLITRKAYLGEIQYASARSQLEEADFPADTGSPLAATVT